TGVTGNHRPSSWALHSPLFLFTAQYGSGLDNDIWSYSTATRTAVQVIAEIKRQQNAVFSPDGRWVIYESDESGRSEIYLQPYPPSPNVKFQITRDGGSHPMWIGKEVLFVNGGTLFSVGIETQPSPRFSEKVRLPITGFIQAAGSSNRNYDVTSDGQQFVMNFPPGQTAADSGPPAQIQAVLGWFQELQQTVVSK